MHNSIRALILLLCISPAVHADEAADRAAIEASAQAWTKAFNAHDANALVVLATDDVVLMDPEISAPASGQAAARTAWAKAAGLAQGQITSATKEIVITGDLAWRIGALTHTLADGTVVNRGQSLEIWKRVNGEWKIHRQMSSSVLTRPKLLRRPRLSEPVLDAPKN